MLNRCKGLCMGLRYRISLVKAKIFDVVLGIKTDSDYSSLSQDRSLNGDMLSYGPAPYGRIQRVVSYLKLSSGDVCVDLGCGKGRIVFLLATQKFRKMIGVELDEQMISIARKNLKNLKINRTPIELIHADAAKFDPKDVTVFILFNPFGRATLEMVLENIRKSLADDPRTIRIVYYAPAQRQLLDSLGWLTLEGQIEDENCLVWRNKAAKDF